VNGGGEARLVLIFPNSLLDLLPLVALKVDVIKVKGKNCFSIDIQYIIISK